MYKLSKISIRLITLIAISLITFLAASTTSGSGDSRKNAIKSALKVAVKKEILSMVSQTGYEKKKSEIDKFVADNYGEFVDGFKVLEESSKFGLTNVSLSYDIGSKNLKKSLFDSKILFGISGKPRVMIILNEKIAGADSFEKTATFAFEKIFLNKGFKIIEPNDKSIIPNVKELNTMDKKQLADIAFKSGADILIKGNVSVGKGMAKEIYGISHYSVPIQMNVHILRADNGEVIATRTKSIKKNAEDEFTAGQFGLDIGGKMLAKSLVKDLSSIWLDEIFTQGKLELVAEGSGKDLQSLENGISSIPFVKSITLRYMENGTTLYDIDMNGSIQDLRDAVSKSKNWRVNLVTGKRLGVILKSREGDSVSYDYKEPNLEIKELKFSPIFPSRLRYYEKTKTVDVKILSQENLSNVKLSVIVPELMSLSIDTVISSLTAGVEKSVSLILPLESSKLINNHSDKKVSGKAVISFISNGKTITRSLTSRTTIYSINAMDWAESKSIGSFVTYQNPTIDKFSRTVVTQIDNTSVNSQFESAVAIFTALKKFGVKYLKDPIVEANSNVLDKVQFPIETLEKKSGDCDDSSVLFASLLAAAGIDCAFMLYPDHVLIMFDTGIYRKNVYKLGVTEESVVIHNNKCWIPVETTILNKSFVDAWTIAAKEYNQAVIDGENIEIIELKDSWAKYPPFAYNRTNKTVFGGSINSELKGELGLVDKKLSSSIKAQITSLEAGSQSTENSNKLGILYGRDRQYGKSVETFKRLISANGMVETYNNYGCALLLTGDEKAAIKEFEKSLAISKTPAALVNRALAYYVSSDSNEDLTKFISALQEANGILPEGESLADLLGIDLGDISTEKAAGEHEAAAPKTIDKRRLQELIRKRVLSRDMASKDSNSGEKSGYNVMPFGGVRGADPTQVAIVADLLYWMEIK